MKWPASFPRLPDTQPRVRRDGPRDPPPPATFRILRELARAPLRQWLRLKPEEFGISRELFDVSIHRLRRRGWKIEKPEGLPYRIRLNPDQARSIRLWMIDRWDDTAVRRIAKEFGFARTAQRS